MKKNKLFLLSIIALGIFASCDTSEQDFEKAKQQGTAKAYDTFISNHLKSGLVEVARDSIVALFDRMEDLHSVFDGIQGIVDYDAASMVRTNLEQRVDQLYEWATEKNTIEGWNYYLESVPDEYQKDAQDRRLILQWENENMAWLLASENDDVASYEKYLELHPKGRHAKQAERSLIDKEVASAFAGEHGTLPSMDKGYSTGTSYSVIEIENKTQYELTVSYSGPDSKRMMIQPYGKESMRIGNGSYRVAANVGHGVIPFAGTEYLDGSQFSSSFYIETRRY